MGKKRRLQSNLFPTLGCLLLLLGERKEGRERGREGGKGGREGEREGERGGERKGGRKGERKKFNIKRR